MQHHGRLAGRHVSPQTVSGESPLLSEGLGSTSNAGFHGSVGDIGIAAMRDSGHRGARRFRDANPPRVPQFASMMAGAARPTAATDVTDAASARAATQRVASSEASGRGGLPSPLPPLPGSASPVRRADGAACASASPSPEPASLCASKAMPRHAASASSSTRKRSTWCKMLWLSGR